MAFCRGRLFSDGQEGPRFEDIPTFDLGDSEPENDGGYDSHEINSSISSRESLKDISMEFASPLNKLSSGLDEDDSFWPVFTSPTPVSSPQPKRPVSRIRKMNLSPIAMAKLDDQETVNISHMFVDDSGICNENPPSPIGNTPPHNRLKALRLFDTPHTPKSLLHRAQRKANKSSSQKANINNKIKKYVEDRPQANVNPFTPKINNNNNIYPQTTGIKRLRPVESVLDDSLEADMDDEIPSNKRLALREINTSRYNEEFYEVCKLGDGEFGSVYKCINRLDGVTYAIKKSKRPVAGSVYERNAMNEVYAHAVLGKHPQVVRYYSAWAEKDHMFIQNEYCNGGSLADQVIENKRVGRHYSEDELKQILKQLALGLKYIHSQELVHLDIKPGNIFIHCNPKLLNSPESGMEEDMADDEDSVNAEMAIMFKIGDLGHVTSVNNPAVDEGDCRYLPNEILQENTDNLTKADIFSLALTIFVAGGGGDLPKNGDDWHAIRQGKLPHLRHYSDELNTLLKTMIHPDPHVRPSASTLANHPILCPFGMKTKAQLRRELNEQKFKNQSLARQLREAQLNKKIDQLTTMKPSNDRSTRLVGRRVNRSTSLTAF